MIPSDSHVASQMCTLTELQREPKVNTGGSEGGGWTLRPGGGEVGKVGGRKK